jgi:hypothetical protein
VSTLRKILLFLFVALYLVVAPLTVLYALGYIFSPVKQALLQTGLVSLGSDPPQATVWVNGTPLKDKTPVVLRSLGPGSYEVRLTLPGYHAWQRQVKVEAERAIRLENILLFPDKLKPEVVGELPIKRIWSVPDGKPLVVLQGETAAGLNLFNVEKNLLQPIFVEPRDQDAKVKDVSLHPLGDRAIVLLERGGTVEPILVKFTDPLELQSLADLFPEPFTELRWSVHLKDSLFYLKEGRLKRIDLEHRLFHPVLAKEVRGFAPHGRHLYLLDGRRRFLRLSEKGKLLEILLDRPTQARRIFAQDRSYEITLLNRSLALFLSDTGRLLSNKLPYLLDEEVEEIIPALSRPRILYRKGTELWTVDFEKEREKTFFESGPVARRIYEGDQPSANFFWFYEDRYLLFSEGNRILVQDFEGEGKALELVEISPRAREVALDARQGFLYFAHPKSDRLARVKVFEGGWILPRLVDELMSPAEESS